MRSPDEGLRLRAVSKSFGNVAALRELELGVDAGEMLAIIGPSGAGKTTTCRVICGLERPDCGEILVGGVAIQDLPPQRRNIAYTFESFALYSQLTVFENVAFPLQAPARQSAYDAREIARRVREVLELVDMASLENRLPSELSGGQKQRVALSRALVQEPSLYLLDEPISHLDAKLRHRLRGELRRRLKGSGAPTIWCTPDGLEALSVADRMAVVVNGVLEQIDTPERIYLAPASARVARLIGDPPTNLLTGVLAAENGHVAFRCDNLSVALPDLVRQRLARRAYVDAVCLGVRPTDITLARADRTDGGALAEVYTYEPFGKYGITTVRLADKLLKSKCFEQCAFRPGEAVRISLNSASLLFFDAATGNSI